MIEEFFQKYEDKNRFIENDDPITLSELKLPKNVDVEKKNTFKIRGENYFLPIEENEKYLKLQPKKQMLYKITEKYTPKESMFVSNIGYRSRFMTKIEQREYLGFEFLQDLDTSPIKSHIQEIIYDVSYDKNKNTNLEPLDLCFKTIKDLRIFDILNDNEKIDFGLKLYRWEKLSMDTKENNAIPNYTYIELNNLEQKWLLTKISYFTEKEQVKSICHYKFDLSPTLFPNINTFYGTYRLTSN